MHYPSNTVGSLLISAGLPQIAELVVDAKSYAERLFKFPKIGSLDLDDAKKALGEPADLEGVNFNNDALDRAFEQTEGYSYFIQELGYQTTAMELEEVPDSLLVIGGGYVALEQAQLFARLGSKVTMLVRSRLPRRRNPTPPTP